MLSVRCAAGAAREQHQARGGHVEPVHDQRVAEGGLHLCTEAVLTVLAAPGTDSKPAG